MTLKAGESVHAGPNDPRGEDVAVSPERSSRRISSKKGSWDVMPIGYQLSRLFLPRRAPSGISINCRLRRPIADGRDW